MALTLTDLGADEILKTYFNNTRPVGGNNLTLRLFANDVIPAQVGVTYTEVIGGGYAAIVLTNGSWVVDPVADPSAATYAQQTFLFTGQTDATTPSIYGYYVTDADGTVIYAERLVAAFTPASDGDNIKITPKVELSSGTPA